MSVKQHIDISCDNFECQAALSSDVSLLDARAEAGRDGWVNRILFVGSARRVVLQDFCPAHRAQEIDSLRLRTQLAKPVREPVDMRDGP